MNFLGLPAKVKLRNILEKVWLSSVRFPASKKSGPVPVIAFGKFFSQTTKRVVEHFMANVTSKSTSLYLPKG